MITMLNIQVRPVPPKQGRYIFCYWSGRHDVTLCNNEVDFKDLFSLPAD